VSLVWFVGAKPSPESALICGFQSFSCGGVVLGNPRLKSERGPR
jgi:hypothetical protein